MKQEIQMKKVKAINKGYTITVTSWENDGDNSRTKSITVDSKELAKALKDLCNNVFISGKKGIGNFNDVEEEEAKKIVIPYMKKHPELYTDIKIEDDDHLYDICMEYAYELMGSSEWYICRVMESCMVTYSDKDIFLEEVKF